MRKNKCIRRVMRTIVAFTLSVAMVLSSEAMGSYVFAAEAVQVQGNEEEAIVTNEEETTTEAEAVEPVIQENLELEKADTHDGSCHITNPWTSDNSLPTSGNYYLTKDVTLTDLGATVSGDLTICLNGYKITQTTDNMVFNVPAGNTLSINDCATSNTGAIVGHSTKGTSYAVRVDGTFNLYNGTITGNHGAAGVYQNGTMTVANFAKVSDNTGADGNPCNVYLTADKTIAVDANIDYSSYIGISTSIAPSKDSPIRITGEITGNDMINSAGLHLRSDSSSCVVQSVITETFPFKGYIQLVSGHNHDNLLFEPWDDATTLPTKGNYYLNTDVTLDTRETTTVAKNTNLNLCLNGHIIKQTNDGIVYTVAGTMNLYDEEGTNHKYTNSKGLYSLDDESGTITLSGGAITGVNGNVAISVTKGRLNIYSGNIVGNTSGGFGGIKTFGGKIYIYGGRIIGNVVTGKSGKGGGINIDSTGYLDMSGGYISDNTAVWGGGIYSTGTVKISAGTIDNNYASSNGGGINIDSTGYLDMSGGYISDNTAVWGGGIYSTGTVKISAGTIDNNYASSNGGGICNLSTGKMEISGGTITDNTAKEKGGGVYYSTSSDICTISGGAITDNKAALGGGVYVNETGLTASGNLKITGNTDLEASALSNLYLVSNSTIKTGTFTSGANVGISTANAPNETTQVTLTEGSSENNSSYFTSDNTSYKVVNTVEDSNNVLKLDVADINTVAQPTITPGTSANAEKVTVAMSCATSGAEIYYTTDGTEPYDGTYPYDASKLSGTKYTVPITISSTATVKAVAVMTGYKASSIASAKYTISKKVETPTFTPSGGQYSEAQSVAISTETVGASIYYTMDGTTPTDKSILYNGPIEVNSSKTIKAIATKSGYEQSGVGTSSYTIKKATVATPTFSLAEGTYGEDKSITISCETTGATIYYTTDGSDPADSTQSYISGSSIDISSTTTLRAIAKKDGMENSGEKKALYTINKTVAAPTANIPSATYASVQNVILSCTTDGAKIYYTTDGSDPTTASNLYTASIPVSKTTTIKAKAFKEGYNASTVLSRTYTIGIKVVSVALDSNTFNVGNIKTDTKTKQLKATISPSDATNTSITWTSDNLNIATVSDAGLVTVIRAGKATITAITADGAKTAKCVVTAYEPWNTPAAPTLKASSNTTIELNVVSGCEYGIKKPEGSAIVWQPGAAFTGLAPSTTYTFYARKVASGYYITSSASKGISISTATAPAVKVAYRTHVQTYGWQPYVSNGDMAGTSGKSKRLEGINIKVEGNPNLGIQYTTHVQTYGWLGWAKNGEPSGTAGYSKRLEGIEIIIVKRDGYLSPTGTTGVVSKYSQPYISKSGSSATTIPGSATATNIRYQTHVQSYGWQAWKYNGAMSGTSGESKRLEGINILFSNKEYAGSIRYKTQVQTYGWQSWSYDGAMSGTKGESKRLEAIQIQLTGEMANKYDVYYRVHAQSYGWLDWAKNGASAGTEGLSKRLEGIEIVLVPKGGQAPGSIARPFVKK